MNPKLHSPVCRALTASLSNTPVPRKKILQGLPPHFSYLEKKNHHFDSVSSCRVLTSSPKSAILRPRQFHHIRGVLVPYPFILTHQFFNMSNQILSVLEYMEKEKGINRADMIDAIIDAIKNGAEKGVNAGQELKIQIDNRTGSLKAWVILQVVDSISDPLTEIHIDKALQENPNLRIGSVYEKEIDPSDLGRIAAQAARQAIMQRIRQLEKDQVYEEYKDTVGDIVSGIVRRRDRNDLIIDLGKTEAMLPARERIPGEEYTVGERIRCLLLKIDATPRGPELILSRSHPKFVRRLFELEVSEIGDGTVTIEALARDPGYRTKICVQSTDSKVDPVGACVGARGARVKTIVRELGGEKIDVLRYFADPKKMLEEAIKPAVPRNIRIDEANHRIYFEVSPEDLSVAIGRKFQNAKLTSKILGWPLDIAKEEKQTMNFQKHVQRAVLGLNQISGLTEEQANLLVNSGITSPEAFEGVTVNDLIGLSFTEEEANQVIAKYEEYKKSKTV